MKVKIKKLTDGATLPTYAKPGDGAMDITAISKTETTKYTEYGTGLALQIPEGYVGLLFPRSSVSEQDLVLANSVGMIDSGYVGELKVRFKKVVHNLRKYNPNTFAFMVTHDYAPFDKVAQLLIIPRPLVEWEEVDELDETERGDGGFGSTGK